MTSQKALFEYNNKVVEIEETTRSLYLKINSSVPPKCLHFDTFYLLTDNSYDILSRFISIKTNEDVKKFINECGFIFELKENKEYKFNYEIIKQFAFHLNIVTRLMFEISAEVPNPSTLFNYCMTLLFSHQANVEIDGINYRTSDYDFKNVIMKERDELQGNSISNITINCIELKKDIIKKKGDFEFSYPDITIAICDSLPNAEVSLDRLNYDYICNNPISQYIFADNQYASLLNLGIILLEYEINAIIQNIKPTLSANDFQCATHIPNLYTAMFYALTYINPYAYEIAECANKRFNHYHIRRKILASQSENSKEGSRIFCCKKCRDVETKANSRKRK